MIHVAYCIDKNYRQHFGASVTSLLLNFAGDGADLSIHVVTDEADPACKAQIALYLVGPQDIQAMAPLKGTSAPHVTTATHFRFLLPRTTTWTRRSPVRCCIPDALARKGFFLEGQA